MMERAKATLTKPFVQALLIASLIICATFPDVIFAGASLRLTDQFNGGIFGTHPANVYPVPRHLGWWSGYNDTGGAIFQSEPMIEFMARTLSSGDSPYWNPYSASGALGPEALVDLKFSAFTIANALAGGSSIAFNITLLLSYFVGLFFIYLIVRQVLGLSIIAAIAACLMFVLNGYSVANFGSNVTHSYPHVPAFLYSSLLFFTAPSVGRYVGVVLTSAILLSFTFLPTTIVSIAAVYGICLGVIILRLRQPSLSFSGALLLVSIHISGLLAALLLLAVIYFPVLENIGSLGLLQDYTQRSFFGLYFPAALTSLLSPSLFFESYNAMEPAAAAFWKSAIGQFSFVGNTTYHLGIVALALVGFSWAKHKSKIGPVASVCALVPLIVLCRLFTLPVLTNVFGAIPVIGNIGAQYWWSAIVIPVALLSAIGMENILRDDARNWPALTLAGVAGAGIAYVAVIYGLRAPNRDFKISALVATAALALAISTLVALIQTKRNVQLRHILACAILGLMFSELIYDSKMIRFQRIDFFAKPPAAIEFVKARAGLARTLNIGQGGLYPELGSAFGVQEATSTNEGSPLLYKDYFSSVLNLDPSQRLAHFPTAYFVQDDTSKSAIDWTKVNTLGVRYILIPRNYLNYREEFLSRELPIALETASTVVFENTSALPRAFTIPFPPANVSQLEVFLPALAHSDVHSAAITTYRNTHVTIETVTENESLLVLTDVWHPNWRATLNGRPTDIVRVDATFRGVRLVKGVNLVEMTYRPHTLTIAIVTSLGVLMLLLFAWNFRRQLEAAFSRLLGDKLRPHPLR